MEKHKRYLVFGCMAYYPNGGLGDLIETYNSIDECRKRIRRNDYDYYSIYDRIEGVEIEFKNE